jgi:hypothetical protein
MAAHPGLGRRGFAILVLLVGLLAAWVWVGRRAKPSSPQHDGGVLARVPPGAMLVATVDVAALRQTEIGRNLLGEGRSISGLGQVQELCGSDPMDQVDELAIAVPAAGIDAGFGLFATGRFDAQSFVACAERIVSKRGGRPVTEPRDGFQVMRDAGMSTSSAQLAIEDGGMVLAEPAYVQSALAFAAGDHARPADDPHGLLRESVEPGIVVATAVLSDDQRRTLADELRSQRMADSPFVDVVSAALSLRLTEVIAVHGVLRCDKATSCAAIAQLLDQARKEEASSLTARAVGLDKVLSRVAVRASEAGVHVEAAIPVDEALQLVRRLVALRHLSEQLPDDAPEAPEAPEPPDPPPVPEDAGLRVPASAPTPQAPVQP